MFLKTDSGKGLPYGDEPTDLSRVFPDYVLQAARGVRLGIRGGRSRSVTDSRKGQRDAHADAITPTERPMDTETRLNYAACSTRRWLSIARACSSGA